MESKGRFVKQVAAALVTHVPGIELLGPSLQTTGHFEKVSE
jgi:hypothetical protein